MKKWIIAVVIIALAALVFLNIKKSKGQAVDVQTEVVKKHTVEEKVSASGRVQPVTQVSISANVAGEIVAIHVREGQNVKKGQLLAELDKVRYEAVLTSAKATFSSTKVALDRAEKELERAKTLFKDKNLSQADLDRVISDYEGIKGNLAQAEANLKQAEDNLQKTTIIAPINGTVIQLRKEAGEIALGSQFQADIIMVVADLTKMEVEVDVNENDVVRVGIHDAVDIEIDAIPDTTFKGKVTEIAHMAQSTGLGTQESVTQFKVVVEMLEFPEKLRPGMSATVEILTDKAENTLAVPIQSVTVRSRESVFKNEESSENEENGRKNKKRSEMIEVVFRVEADTVSAVPVKIGLSSQDLFQILSGLNEGDVIVTGNHKVLSRELQTGMRVKIESPDDNKKDKKKLRS